MKVHGTQRTLDDLDQHLKLWLAEGLISAEQAERILLEEAGLERAAPRARSGVLTEAALYVGGVLTIAASFMLSARWWNDVSPEVRVGIAFAACAGLLAAGALVPVTTARGRRLRSVAWLLATGTCALALGLLAHQIWRLHANWAVMLVSGGTMLPAWVLWRQTRHLLQQWTVFGLQCTFAAAALAQIAPAGHSASLPGLGVVMVSAGWLAAVMTGRLRPRGLGMLVYGMGIAVATGPLTDSGWGRGVALLVVAMLLAVAVAADEQGLLAVASLALFIVVPSVLSSWFPGRLAVPIALLVCGAVLLVVALRALRRQHRPHTR